MEPGEGAGRPKIIKKKIQKGQQRDEGEFESSLQSDKEVQELEQVDNIKCMPKKNLQIEVIDHPEANSKAEQIENGEGSFVESDPNQYSEQEEPNHRKGTENEDYEENENGEQK